MYLNKKRIELLKQEFELLTGIKLKIFLQQLNNRDGFIKIQTIRNKQGFAIIITIKGKIKAKKLYILGSQFENLITVINKYWKIKQNSVYITYCRIVYELTKSCRNLQAQCIIYTKIQKKKFINIK